MPQDVGQRWHMVIRNHQCVDGLPVAVRSSPDYHAWMKLTP